MTSSTKPMIEAFEYTKQNWYMFLLIGFLYLIENSKGILQSIGITGQNYITLIFGILTVITTLILEGYAIDIIKENIYSGKDIPKFRLIDNFIEGIKESVVAIIYFVIPSSITVLIGFFVIDKKALIELITYITEHISYSTVVPSYIIRPFIGSLTIMIILAAILIIFFELLLLVGTCRLAKYGKLKEVFKFYSILKDIRKIGLLSFAKWITLLLVIITLIGLLQSVINSFPLIGHLIVSLVIAPFSFLFLNATLGRLYSQIE